MYDIFIRLKIMSVNENGPTLPVCHVYFPTTLAPVLSSFLEENPNQPCILLGDLELRPGKPIKAPQKAETFARSCMEKSVNAIVNTAACFVRSRSSKSRSKSKSNKGRKEGGGGGVVGVEPPTVPEQEQHVIKHEDVGVGTHNQSLVYAVNIIGITSSYEKAVQLQNNSNSSLKIVGEVCTTENGGVRDSQLDNMVSLFLDLKMTPAGGRFGSDPELSVEMIYWKKRWFYSDPRHVIMFDYDPFEFQKWKVPQAYPLGVPTVFINGITYIQSDQRNDNLPFTPVFPKVDQDHQDLNACTTPPSYLTSMNRIVTCIQKSAGLQQISHKLSIMVAAILGNYPILPVLNFLFLLVVDSVIGYVISSYLLQLPNMLGLLHTTVDQMLAKLNHLLRWLRGAPAGLKLNPNLNSLYWRFFSYHIHLWANYIGILEPVFAVILNTIQYLGVLGATIQISLLKDLLSLATFHVYCLYIYATKLYSLQTTAIKALCRVFFGRKYNPLRKRIDHVQLTTPELFLSSFGFVILIFLFPTTMVYYTGFVFLRVPVLLIERLLRYIVVAFNNLPFVSWALVYLRSPRVADEIYLMPKMGSSGTLTFRLCLQSTRNLFQPPDFGKEIKKLVSSVMDGTVLKE